MTEITSFSSKGQPGQLHMIKEQEFALYSIAIHYIIVEEIVILFY
jgi:hypothetical protein